MGGPADDAWGTSRQSRLFPGPWLIHADLHNHTTLSDGAGAPAEAFASMRAAGLDAAAITDHSRWATLAMGLVAMPGNTGIDRFGWEAAGRLADAADDPGAFVAMRGFEWSSALFGHANVWRSARFTDPLRSGVVAMGPFWRWLENHGQDGLAGFNHAGSAVLRFGRFRHRPSVAERVVSFEIFNKTHEHLLLGTDRGRPSALVQCLDAGWRVGLLGVTDEHGTDWGHPEGKGRAGLYVHELSRAGVYEALAARRFFASRVKGLRLDAALSGVRMGGDVPHQGGPARVTVDLDRAGWTGRPLGVQLLRTGPGLPTLAAAVEVRVPGPDEPLVAFDVDIDPAAGNWAVLRVTDPAGPADPPATGEWAELGRAVAYSSPFWLVPAGNGRQGPPAGLRQPPSVP
jgi:hypothetical protein